jgi:hypothetical protein
MTVPAELTCLQVTEVSALVEPAAEASQAEIVEDEEEEHEQELIVQATSLPESNFETELDPVTGIYRLKPREKSQAGEAVGAAESQQADESQQDEPPAAGHVCQCSGEFEEGHVHEGEATESLSGAEALSEDEAQTREIYFHEENGESHEEMSESAVCRADENSGDEADYSGQEEPGEGQQEPEAIQQD